MSRYFDPRHAPVRLQFHQEPNNKTPLARKEYHTLEGSHLSQTTKVNDVSVYPSQFHFPNQTLYDTFNPQPSDYNKLTKELSVLKTQIDSIRADNRKLSAEERKETRWGHNTTNKSPDTMNKTLGESSNFVSRRTGVEEAALKGEVVDLRRQLEATNKRLNDLSHKNTLLESLIQTTVSESDIPRFRESQSSFSLAQTQSEGERQLFSVRLQQQRDEAEGKRKNMEQILLIQDQKMKDKECLIKVLTDKLEDSAKNYQHLERQVAVQSRRIEQLGSQKMSPREGGDTTQLLEAISWKDKEILHLREEVAVAKGVAARREEGNLDLESSRISKMKEDSVREKQKMVQEILVHQTSLRSLQIELQKANNREKNLQESKDKLTALCNEQEELLKKLREEHLIYKEQADKSFVLLKDQQSLQRLLAAQESTTKALKLQVQTLKEEAINLRRRAGKEEQLNSRNQTLLNQLLAAQTHMAEKDTHINTLRSEASTLQRQVKEETQALAKQIAKEKAIIEEKETLHKLILTQNSIISNFKEENTHLTSQLTKGHNISQEKELWMRVASQREVEITSLKDTNAELAVLVAKHKDAVMQREALQKAFTDEQKKQKELRDQILQLSSEVSQQKHILNGKEQELKEQVAKLDSLIWTNKNVTNEKEAWMKVVQEREADIKNLNEQVRVLGSHAIKEKELFQEKDGYQKLILTKDASIKNLKEEAVNLQRQLGRESALIHQKETLQRVVDQQNQSLNSLRQQMAIKASTSNESMAALQQQLRTKSHTINLFEAQERQLQQNCSEAEQKTLRANQQLQKVITEQESSLREISTLQLENRKLVCQREEFFNKKDVPLPPQPLQPEKDIPSKDSDPLLKQQLKLKEQTICSLQTTTRNLQKSLEHTQHIHHDLSKKCQQLESLLCDSNSLLLGLTLTALNRKLQIQQPEDLN